MPDWSSIEDTLLYFFENTKIAPDGAVYEVKKLVSRVSGIRIEVRLGEHAPPHFHVAYGESSGSFLIENCSIRDGGLPPKRIKQLRAWYDSVGRGLLVEEWNKTRPSDCPVGEIAI